MALPITELDAYVHKSIIPRSTEVIYKNSPVLTRLSTKNMERFQGGTQIQRPIMVGKLNGDAVGRGEAFDTDFVVTDTALRNDMKAFYVNISLYGFDGIADDGPEAVFSQVQLKFQNAAMRMSELLATNMYLSNTGTRAKYLDGLDMWYDDGNVYTTIGGITRSDVLTVGTVGGLNAYTATLTSVTLRDFQKAYSQSWWGSDHVDLITVTPNGYDMIWNALQPLQRYQPVSGDMTGETGFQAFRFNAADVVVDRYMPTAANGKGTAFGLNTNYIEWYFSQNKKFQYGFTGFKEQANSMDVAGQFLVANNIVCPNPRSGFKLYSSLF